MKLEHSNVIITGSESDVRKNVSEVTNSIGLLVHGENDKPIIEFVTHGYENDEIVTTLIVAMKDEINNAMGNEFDVEVMTIGNQANYEKNSCKQILTASLPCYGTDNAWIYVSCLTRLH